MTILDLSRWDIAVHEAGHAVVATRLGYRVDRIDWHPDGGSTSIRWPANVDRQDAAMVYLAGYLANVVDSNILSAGYVQAVLARHADTPDLINARSDADASGTPFPDLVARTFQAVVADWSPIVSVADLLLTRPRRLPGAAVRAAVKRTLPQPTPERTSHE